jgi:pimeloyl-ACP methyl ester carboxylesterase
LTNQGAAAASDVPMLKLPWVPNIDDSTISVIDTKTNSVTPIPHQASTRIARVRVTLPDGTRIFFEVVGAKLRPDGPVMHEAPTMLLLHGGPGFDHSSLLHNLSPLADLAQLVFLDHRGQGRSDVSDAEHWRVDRWIDDVVEFCDALELEHPIILGQSFGGVVALGVGARHPGLPAKLVVSSSLAKFRLDRALPMFEQLGGPHARAVASAYFDDPNEETREEFMRVCLPLYNQAPQDPDVIERTLFRHEVGIHFFRGEGMTVDLFPELGRVTAPTLVLGGEFDPITPVADAEDIAAAIPHARLEIVAGAGHGVFRDKPDKAVAMIREFVLS